MHTWRKDLPREEKFTKNYTHPSFSSTLLDEIYRSIDKNNVENQVLKAEKVGKNKKPKEDEEMASHIRACFVEKWMEKKINEKISIKRPPLLPNIEKDLRHPFQDNDPMFFSSSSASSDSSSGGLSSSDSEFFAAAKTRKSCFAAPWPKPIKTKVSSKQSPPPAMPQAKAEGLMKSRSRDLKIYGDLKNVKQPISPGGRLTSLINSLFTNGSSKKSKNCNSNISSKTGERKTKSTQTSTCSSAASFSRQYLSKTPTISRNKVDKKTVSFYPGSVIVDKDSCPCGHKCIDDINIMGYEEKKIKGKKIEYQSYKKDDFMAERSIEEDEDEDAASDCSSDLFEIDHLAMFGNTRFCEELPVYETTHLDKNLAID